MLTYALGRGLQHYDMPVVRGIVSKAQREDYRFSRFVMGIVTSTPFQMRVKGPDGEGSPLARRASGRRRGTGPTVRLSQAGSFRPGSAVAGS